MKYTAHDLEVMGSNPGRVELGMCGILSKSYLKKKYVCALSECTHTLDRYVSFMFMAQRKTYLILPGFLLPHISIISVDAFTSLLST